MLLSARTIFGVMLLYLVIDFVGCKKIRIKKKDMIPRGKKWKSSLPNHFLVNGVDNTHRVVADYEEEVLQQAETSFEIPQEANSTDSGERKKRFFQTTNLWEKGIVIYQFDTITEETRNAFNEAKARIEAESCIRMFEYTPDIHAEKGLTHTTRLNVIEGGGCGSFVGMIASLTLQDINPCKNLNIATHELFHALGSKHEHEDFIRNEYIDVLIDNVRPGLEGAFSIPDRDESDFVPGVPYDVQSVVHYTKYAFSELGYLTIRAYRDDILGEQTNTWYNFKEISTAYSCYSPEHGCPDTVPTCSNEGYPGVKDGICQCICPEGYDRSTGCTTLDPAFDCGGLINLDSGNTPVVISTPDYDSAMPTNTVCIWIIKTSGNDRIAVDLEPEIPGSFSGCDASLIIKRELVGQQGVEYCGDGFQKTVLSVGNYVVIKVDSRDTTTTKLRATARLLPESQLCYNVADWGATYNGGMDRASDLDNSPCLDWADTTHCDLNPFKYPSNGVDLTGNQCRNVGDKLQQPWCYTAVSGGGCTIKYCDACADGKPFDTWDNCQEKIDSDPAFCSSTDAEFHCMKTCGLAFPTISSSNDCGSPGQLAGATLTTISTTTVGSTATYTCDEDSSITGSRTCLSTGMWSELDNLCPVPETAPSCPPDYTQNGDYCYKAYNRRFTKGRWDTQCAADGAILSPAENLEEQNFITGLTNSVSPGYFFYIGAVYTGSWEWEYNGASLSYTNWFRGFPRQSRRRRCAVILSSRYDNTWYTTRCQRRFRAVCRKDATTVASGPVCGDQRPACQSMLSRVKGMCDTDWAVGCSLTCGNCGATDVTCPVSAPPASSNVELQTSSPLLPGSVAIYTCTANNVRLSGELWRACTIDGTLTGTEPVCGDESLTSRELNDMDIEELWYFMPGGSLAVGQTPFMTFTSSGYIKALKAYCVGSGDVIFYVMSLTGEVFTILESKTVTCERSRTNIWELATGDQIQVEVGNVLGVRPLANNIITMNDCSDEDSKLYFFFPGTINVGDTLDVSSRSKSCRVTPIDAVIIPL